MKESGSEIAIGFDAKRAFFNQSGLGNYSRTLLRQLAHHYPDLQLHLFSSRSANPEAFLPAGVGQVHLPNGNRLGWRSWGLSRDLKRSALPIYHGLSHELPLGIQQTGLVPVVTMHDAIFRRFPGHYPLFDRLVYDYKWAHSCRHAAQVVAISEATRQDLLNYYPLQENRVQVIYQSLGEKFQQKSTLQAQQQVRKTYRLPQDYLLFVGSLTVRKNLLGLLKALATLPSAQRPPLVVVGQGHSYQRQMGAYLHRQGMAKEVFFRPELKDEDLPALYGGALALAYPSLYEGFGLPIVEALSQGTPVVTSDVSAMPEAAGPGALLIDPENHAELAEAVERLVHDEALQQELVEKGRTHIERFDSPHIARQWYALYRRLLSEQPRGVLR